MSGITIIGTTTWGKTLALVLARKGLKVNLWARTAHEAEKIMNDDENFNNSATGFTALIAITSSLPDATAG